MSFPLAAISFTEQKDKVGTTEYIKIGTLTRTLVAADLAVNTIYYIPATFYSRVSDWREICVRVLPIINNIRDFWIEETVDGTNFFPVAGLVVAVPVVNQWNNLQTGLKLGYIRVAVRTLAAPNPVPVTLIILLEVRR